MVPLGVGPGIPETVGRGWWSKAEGWEVLEFPKDPAWQSSEGILKVKCILYELCLSKSFILRMHFEPHTIYKYVSGIKKLKYGSRAAPPTATIFPAEK